MWWWLIPVVVLGLLAVLFGVLIVLGRYRGGVLLRPLVTWLSRWSFMRRAFTRMSTAAIERQNPELAGALRKINRVAANPNPQAMQKAMSSLTANERRAYLEAAQEQGAMGDSAANRQMRRQAERLQQGTKPPGGRSGGNRKRRK